jgi:DNA polymerase V
MNKQLIALIDCSSFYCSCERAFRADLDGKAIVVLSNNDGCVISLTPNAKELGIKMGTPYYQIKKELDQKGITVFSSNYCLYADMSKRVINIIRRFADDVEQYSIDEAFARFTVDTDHIEEARAKMQQIAEDIH